MKKLSLVVMTLGMLSVLQAAEEYVNGYTWTYRIVNGGAVIYGNHDDASSIFYGPSISPSPEGVLTIPSSLGGCPVISIESMQSDFVMILLVLLFLIA